MDWVDVESFWFGCPYFADVFVRCKAFQGLEATPVIVGVYKVGEVVLELLVAVVVVALAAALLRTIRLSAPEELRR